MRITLMWYRSFKLKILKMYFDVLDAAGVYNPVK